MNKRNVKILVLVLLAILSFMAVYMFPPIPQDLSYHNFADQRKFLGIPNFFDTVSNLPFLFVGLWGFSAIPSTQNSNRAKVVLFTLFLGFALLAFGSGYYHWAPGNYTLVYDRLAMAMVFMSFFTLILYDYVHQSRAMFLFPWLVLLGTFSVIWWYLSEVGGRGDLRMYILVQFFPVLAIPYIALAFNGKYGYGREIFFVFIFFFLAKTTEELDEKIFRLSGFISGHTLKHLFMAVSGIFIIRIAKKRQALSPNKN